MSGGIRSFVAPVSKTEEPFVPGIDPGLVDWLRVRKAGRDAKLRGSSVLIITCDIRYKYEQFWKKRFMYKLLVDVESRQDEAPAETLDEVISARNGSDATSQSHETSSVRRESILPEGTYNENSGTFTKKDKPRASLLYEDNTVSLAAFQDMLKSRVAFEDILNTALEKRSALFVQLAVQHGIGVNHRIGFLRRCMLHVACWNGDLAKVDALLALGANPNIRDKNGSTPLHLAIHTPSLFHPVDIIRRLVEKGAKVSVQDKKGRTPLHIACTVGSKVLIELLIASGALLFCLDANNTLPLDHAKNVRTILCRTTYCDMLCWHPISGRQSCTLIHYHTPFGFSCTLSCGPTSAAWRRATRCTRSRRRCGPTSCRATSSDPL
ncbi:ankyrin repeat-containing domain protein [Ochromonadaceae sp. CCMP2298]|nr:ankyrin repeat-containing domain protein [Ochromonadaceae sp. CCMP2298]